MAEDIRIGLLSDCEGNVAALTAVLSALERFAPDLVVHAGDILCCPLSPDPPAETIALLRAEAVKAIPGNHDRYLMDWGTPRWAHTLWMRLRRSDPHPTWLEDVAAGQAAIASRDLEWLRGLPEEFLLTDGVWVCHGMPGNPWNSIWPRSEAFDGNVSDVDRQASLEILAEADAEIVLCGHIPAPWDFRDTLPGGRELRVIRAGQRMAGTVGYAVVTRRADIWDVEWGDAVIPSR